MADTKLTQAQIIAAIKAERDKVAGYTAPSLGIQGTATDAQIAADAASIRSKAELDKFIKTGYLPTHGFAAGALATLDGAPRGQSVAPIMGGAVFGGPLSSAGKGLVEALLKRGSTKAAAEAVAEGAAKAGTQSVDEISKLYQMTYNVSKEEADLMAASQAAAEVGGTASKASRLKNAATWAKNHKIKATLGTAAVLGVGQVATKGGTTPAASTNAVTSQSEADMATAIAQANAAGIDVTTYMNSAAGKQLGLTANNIQSMLAKYGQGTTGLVGINAGVYTGKDVSVPGTWHPGLKVGQVANATTKPELLSLNQWKQQLPITDSKQLASIKQKFVDAGVIGSSAGLQEVQKAWETYGQMSLDASRAGTNMTPWQLLDLQKGLSSGGGGSSTNTTYDVSATSTADVRTYLNRQLSQSLGRQATDEEFKKFLQSVQKAEAAKPTKTVTVTNGKTTNRTTTPGYGASDILSEAEKFAQSDPRYAEYQTSSVFGDALTKALGLKG
jgi:hypothetical protein